MNIAVVLGGYSAERDVSLASGLRIAGALRARGHTVTCVDPAAVDAEGVLSRAAEEALLAAGVGTAPPSLDALAALGEGARGRGERAGIPPALATWPAVQDADVLLLALHGGQGEDGTLQALLDLAGVPYTGSGHLGSALAMDKHRSKLVFRAAGVETADWRMAPLGADAAGRRAFAAEALGALGLPVIVKPSKQGSSVALTVVRDADALWPAVDLAARYDDEVMVERFVAGRELTVGVLGDRELPVIEILPSHEIYDYECKYTAGMTEERVADLPPAVASALQRQARLAFDALGLRGYARVDFRLDAAQLGHCLEVNTLPGMTELSLLPQGAAAAGLDFGALCEEIVRLAVTHAAGAAPAGGVPAAGTAAPARGF
ncbi:D-alanine--D-alanine ligase A [Gemmatimonadetes bacterium T265]|nr:D-alanine--D-alanine ligase A [Gemmatimonadetes bacterium T265]